MTQPSLLDLPADATITLQSKVTGRVFIYRIRRAPNRRAHYHYIDLVVDTTNESPYFRMGRIVRGHYYHSPFSDFPRDSLPARAFGWYWAHRDNLPNTIFVTTFRNLQAA